MISHAALQEEAKKAITRIVLDKVVSARLRMASLNELVDIILCHLADLREEAKKGESR